MTVLLAGCGKLGSAAGLRFAELGHPVTALRRRPELVPEPLRGMRADLTAGPPEIPGAPDIGIAVIALTADDRTAQGYSRTYVDGLRNLLDGLDRSDARPSRVLLVSSTAVYGEQHGARVDESTPPAPSSATAPALVEAERVLHERFPEAIVLRLSGIYGRPNARTLDRIAAGGTTADPDHITNRIHQDDAARAIVHLTTEVPRPANVYLGSDDLPVDQAELHRFLAAELGAPPPAEQRADPPAPTGKRCVNDRLRRSGFTFTYPTFREGYRAQIAARR
ncbi:NAD-dependent epimerase/dehydratase family protein [Saccharopolyspora sp. HNM0983]|uniref:NAD-dependent epimerase/dehydratase family protein n=1 Tax=Saccharopolyspora montiporae TaxID=2781240 RepID=A0A929B7U9_9PSEU|nr:NAD-dependent epimerase/dehydratase family protein [Saccharopolyspora sp. HNM0983]MBE9373861.1 NAD-dependent epimerase/dehydratase family protein [Saccharopolyspora sp. HNM0983]